MTSPLYWYTCILTIDLYIYFIISFPHSYPLSFPLSYPLFFPSLSLLLSPFLNLSVLSSSTLPPSFLSSTFLLLPPLSTLLFLHPSLLLSPTFQPPLHYSLPPSHLSSPSLPLPSTHPALSFSVFSSDLLLLQFLTFHTLLLSSSLASLSPSVIKSLSLPHSLPAFSSLPFSSIFLFLSPNSITSFLASFLSLPFFSTFPAYPPPLSTYSLLFPPPYRHSPSPSYTLPILSISHPSINNLFFWWADIYICKFGYQWARILATVPATTFQGWGLKKIHSKYIWRSTGFFMKELSQRDYIKELHCTIILCSE